MSVSDAESLLEKLKSLPPERVAEIEDFVDFLRGRAVDARLVKAAAGATEAAFHDIWDNEDDAEYDRL